jgi:hypothetical protein
LPRNSITAKELLSWAPILQLQNLNRLHGSSNCGWRHPRYSRSVPRRFSEVFKMYLYPRTVFTLQQVYKSVRFNVGVFGQCSYSRRNLANIFSTVQNILGI